MKGENMDNWNQEGLKNAKKVTEYIQRDYDRTFPKPREGNKYIGRPKNPNNTPLSQVYHKML